MLLACFGVDVLLKHIHVSFPASVACLILLFFGLLLSEVTLGTYRTKVMANYVDISVRPPSSSCPVADVGIHPGGN